MSLPSFVERGQTIASLPSLGLLTLAGHTPGHWQVQYLELDGFDEPGEVAPERALELVGGSYDIVAISALSARILDAYRIADALRKLGVTVVLGGLHVSALPDEAAQHADCVITGQAEVVWAQVLADFESRSLLPRYDVSRTEARPLCADSAPIPRYDLLDPKKYNRISLQSTRGCPRDCGFCGASRTLAPYQRKPIHQVRRELEAITELWKRPFLELADDNTLLHQAWSKELLKLLASYPVRWFTETDISIADDEHLLDHLADSGCAQLLIGLESAQANSLRGIDSANWKWQQADHYASKIRRIQERGISVNGCFVLGLDSDDEDVFQDTLDYVHALGLAEVQLTVLTPFPGTALYESLHREQRLLRPVFWEQCTLFDVTYVPKRMSPSALEQGFHWLVGEMYSDQRVTQRRLDNRERLRQTTRKREV